MSLLSDEYARYIVPSYGRFDLDLERGSGCRAWGLDGTEYLDFGAGIAVCSLGHAHPEVTAAVSAQAAKLVHTSNLYRTQPQIALAKRLVEITGPGKIFSAIAAPRPMRDSLRSLAGLEVRLGGMGFSPLRVPSTVARWPAFPRPVRIK